MKLIHGDSDREIASLALIPEAQRIYHARPERGREFDKEVITSFLPCRCRKSHDWARRLNSRRPL